jgi:hypothetical protein
VSMADILRDSDPEAEELMIEQEEKRGRTPVVQAGDRKPVIRNSQFDIQLPNIEQDVINKLLEKKSEEEDDVLEFDEQQLDLGKLNEQDLHEEIKRASVSDSKKKGGKSVGFVESEEQDVKQPSPNKQKYKGRVGSLSYLCSF